MNINHANRNITYPIYNKNLRFCGDNTKATDITVAQQGESLSNKAVKYGALSVLAGIGLALTFRNSLNTVLSGYKTSLKKGVNKAIEVELPVRYSGPDFRFNNKSKTAISDAWDSYIDTVEHRIESPSSYKKIFTENTKTLDMFEEVANQRIQSRLNQVA